MSKFPLRSFLSQCVDKLTVLVSRFRFGSSGAYWELRYKLRGSSGAGSYGEIARYKADFLNAFCHEYHIEDVLEFGCGDGAQLERANYKRYTGVDISRTAIRQCRDRFSSDLTRRFFHLDDFPGEMADLVLSLDVIYHLVEDSVFQDHLDAVFSSARKFVVIFSTNHSQRSKPGATHVRHRVISTVCTDAFHDFDLVQKPDKDSCEQSVEAGFYVFRKRDQTG